MQRFFSQRQKAALYIAQDGQCAECGQELEEGWHADHVQPFSRGGSTDLVNGQALCPTCNLRKGSNSMVLHATSTTNGNLREWQREALNKCIDVFDEDGKRDFLAVATPGAGKTTWAVTVAKKLLDRRSVRQVVVVVPSDALRTQWSDRTDINLRPYKTGPVKKNGYDGIVTTYQAIANSRGVASDVLAQAMGRSDTLVILDEVHHAADQTVYGEALQQAFENAKYRLLLTGTPWRTNPAEKMPFVTFDADGMLQVDYEYSFQRAVEDSVVRRVQFPSVTATAEWTRDGVTRTEELTVNRMLRGTDTRDATNSMLDASPSGGWMRHVIERANRDLMSMRSEIADAAGLVVAKDRRHATKIADLLQQVTGVRPPVVVSTEDDEDAPDPQRTIENFRSGQAPWIVAVKMIAEGVDIPRLMVGVFATNVTTSMFFNQVVGRFVRVRPGERVTSRVYVVPTAPMWGLVMDLEKSMPQQLVSDELEVQARREAQPGTLGDGPRQSSFFSLGSEAGTLDRVASGGDEFDGSMVDRNELVLQQAGVPTHYATQLAAVGADLGSMVPSEPEPDLVPAYRREKELRDELKSLAGKIAYRHLGHQSKAKDVYLDLYRLHGKSINDQSLSELERSREVARGWLAHGMN